MGKARFSCGVTLWCAALLWPTIVAAGDVFTGYQIDNHGQYFSYLGVRAPLAPGEAKLQPFIQVMGGGFRYIFKDQGVKRDADVQFATPSLGLKYIHRDWNFIGFAGPQFRWKQEERLTGGKSHEDNVGLYAQGEAFYWHEKGTFHAIASYTDLDNFVWSRVRATRLAYKSEQGCCSVYAGWDLSGMGNNDFYAVQTGPLVQLPIDRFYLTFRGGYQYSEVFHNGGYGGVELYFPF